MSEPTQAGAPSAPSAPENKAIPADEEGGGNGRRKRVLLGLTAVVLLCGLAWGVYDWLVLAHYEDTDNAYVQGNVVQITPQIGGTVTAIYADETDRVQAGAPLVKLDGADAELALAQAEAALGQTVRQVRTLYANNSALDAQVRLREADVAKARTQLATAEQDLARRQGLAGGGAVSGEELAHARAQVTAAQSMLKAAQAGVSAAQEQLASNQALTDGTPVAQHPSVLAAAAKLREAWLAAHRTVLPAPVSGYVGKRTVQLGQRVAAGTPLLTVVPLEQVWVDANFKENQLRRIHIGQPVRLTADAYGSKVEFDGTISGLGVSTGAASALLPAQNATGNWIKIVQRVPVRIALDPRELEAHPLRIGLSVTVEVDTSERGGSALGREARSPYAALPESGPEVEAEIERIIAANAGEPR